jgi:hypothetical protein
MFGARCIPTKPNQPQRRQCNFDAYNNGRIHIQHATLDIPDASTSTPLSSNACSHAGYSMNNLPVDLLSILPCPSRADI